MTRFKITRNEKKKTSQKEKASITSGGGITMCNGGECPFKGMCHRYTVEPKKHGQSYFAVPPFKIEKGKPSCEMFWGETAQFLFVMLKEIMEHPIPKKKKQR